MFFRKGKNKSEQHGTLMVEAIAMLGLIAIVTPTLYKKSAERLQEIQDINVASQARTMSQIIETFVRNNTTQFRNFTPDSTTVIEICREDSCSSQPDHLDKYITVGYSSVVPNGFKPDEIRNFGEPRVFAVAEDGSVVFYIIYPAQGANGSIGKMRTARLASLVGANGGFVKEASTLVEGTGGAWMLNSAMIDEFDLPRDLLTENSLVLTNNEPIITRMDDTDTYLYRVPPSTLEEFYHNTMVTDLYLGGNAVDSSLNSTESYEYFSIFNVRKMTLNTDCSANYIYGQSSGVKHCDPDVADLYIGKPDKRFRNEPQKASGVSGSGAKNYGANTGAAWIYGNFAALSDRFKLLHTNYDSTNGGAYDRKGYDLMQFTRLNLDDSTKDEFWDGSEDKLNLTVLSASNEVDSAYVSMMNGMVRVVEQFDGKPVGTKAFLVGGSSFTEDTGHLIAAYESGGVVNQGVVAINSVKSDAAITRINEWGGNVWINGGESSSSESGELLANTNINAAGGQLFAGKGGDWMTAGGIDNSAYVDILRGSSGTGHGRHFSVGGSSYAENMIYANSSVTSLRNGAIRAYEGELTLGNEGGSAVVDKYAGVEGKGNLLKNGAVLAAKYTDILGKTYIGIASEMSSEIDGTPFHRDHWELGVAGSAWVDDLLFANDAWFNSSGFKELHAGFSSFAEYKNTPRRGWLNAYDDGVVIHNRAQAASNTSSGSSAVGGVHAEYTRFLADEDRVYMGDSLGAMARLEDGVAKFGYTDKYSSGLPEPINFVGGDSTRAFVEGKNLAEIYTSSNAVDSSVAVDIQKGAMLFKGHSWRDEDARDGHAYGNEIETHAGQFTLQTAEVRGKDEHGNEIEGTGPEAAMLYADGREIHTRFVDFKVQNNSSENILHVRPNMESSSMTDSANVTVNGSFHVTGNDVFHAATHNAELKAGKPNEPHATFEIDPQFVRVMARNGATSSSFITQGGDTLAMFEVNAYDVDGSSSVDANSGKDPTERASVYVRRGAIELEQSTDGASTAADEGFGYIKANRFVSNAQVDDIPLAPGQTSDGHYDQYMVNPAYTSVMHDIKLTTRGGARLSDILPDYVLKGVYNVSNDYVEGGTKRISWSCGKNCKQPTVSDKIAWADPYVGILPYAICPPGYKNMATIMPTSFEMAQAGDMVKADVRPHGRGTNAFVINPKGSRQADILSQATTTGSFSYPKVVKSIALEQNKAYKNTAGTTFDPEDLYLHRTQGWFYGYEAIHENESDYTKDSKSTMEHKGGKAWYYNPNGASGSSNAEPGYVPEPLYFQQNTYLKTALEPLALSGGSKDSPSGWKARMGFIYDKSQYIGYGDSGLGSDGILSQNAPDGFNEDDDDIEYPFDVPGDWVWNLFPVATNSIEGHATVYCYFDRKSFKNNGWSTMVDDIDQLNEYRKLGDKNAVKPEGYSKRLNDPSMKYSDPW